jgi:hypothetical protein
MKGGIYFHETILFREWMNSKGYIWPSKIIAQENMVGEFMREGLEKVRASAGHQAQDHEEDSRESQPLAR